MKAFITAVLLVIVTTAGMASSAGAQPAPPYAPYQDPPFTCAVIDYGTSPPPLVAPTDDPLCVRYDKTNITVSTLGVVDFLAAEPTRVAIVAGKCSYWQQDHWIVRTTPDATPIVEWEGSYWYDGRTGTAGGIVRNTKVGGQPADGVAFADAIRPLIGDDAADQLATYAAEGGGGGASFTLPAGFGSDVCPTAASEPTTTTSSAVDSTPPTSAVGAGAGGSTLPRTGDGVDITLAAALVLGSLLLHRVARARR